MSDPKLGAPLLPRHVTIYVTSPRQRQTRTGGKHEIRSSSLVGEGDHTHSQRITWLGGRVGEGVDESTEAQPVDPLTDTVLLFYAAGTQRPAMAIYMSYICTTYAFLSLPHCATTRGRQRLQLHIRPIFTQAERWCIQNPVQ